MGETQPQLSLRKATLMDVQSQSGSWIGGARLKVGTALIVQNTSGRSLPSAKAMGSEKMEQFEFVSWVALFAGV